MKKILLPLLILCVSSGLKSQPSLGAAMNPVPYENYATLPLDTASVQPGTPGANKTWDFSSLVFIYNPLWDNYQTAASTLYAASFPDANIASWTNTTSGEFTYHKTMPSGWEIHGFANNLYEFVYTDVKKVMTYPFTYNTQITDTYGGVAQHSGLTITRSGNLSKKGVAYGGIILPTGNFSDVLLIETRETYTDVYSGDVTETRVYTITEYAWYSTSYRFPLLFKRIEEMSIDGTPQSTLAYARVSTEVSGIESTEFNGKLNIYPVPAADYINIDVNDFAHDKIIINCYSVDGRHIATLYEGISQGSQSLRIDVSHLTKGVYFIRLESEKGLMTKRFVKL